ncbi:hypothetical protein KEU06_08690 [Pseudaminobacter sp. 19-2017]|uniref:Uncharacterized protein n=1 Tax=Pseudaminobacter soli (ex Zhang et al. 2022) TaxID=2831468 RepID=A0A942DWL5_9HYPH|nr:hypothetical protein [Pseudaminobacter soli]MBS3648704.1 hypothetical protein [Pseudaminobacter soli]
MLTPMYFELPVPDERQADVQRIVAMAHKDGFDLSENDAYAAYREYSRDTHGVDWWPDAFKPDFHMERDSEVFYDSLSTWLKWND